MSRINGRIAKNADIRRISLHSFRHSCASLLINNGQPVTTVKNTIDNLNLGI